MGRYRDTGTVEMRRSGRPKATTAVDACYLRISARRKPESNATKLNNAFRAATGRCVSTQTVRNRLHDVQLHSRRPWRGLHMWNLDTMERGTGGPKNTLIRLVRIGIKCIKVMNFWGGIMWGRRTPLMVMEGSDTTIRYRNDFLRPIVQRYLQNFGEEFVLMDDSSCPHRAHLLNEFLHDNNIARLECPACSPGVNPVPLWELYSESPLRNWTNRTSMN